ncbi:PTS sugar transporter subunit IIA [Paraburkholderia sp. BCC1885]|uniref:PTS sugar transporter subunit IIA n=1 Tax=Paraburkholderia sp. BCC1885 TaxID=2562669 RepID=UPI001181D860|nr:PTS sugar transporter subunit IIA [Paraburkholderia sp. BCC1885]
MTHPMTSLRALLGAGRRAAQPRSHRTVGRNVMMHVTLDAQHATPLRQALTRDCGDQPWTIRVAPLPGSGRVRLSLYLPKTAVNGAIQRVAHIAPTAQMGQLFEVPDAPTDVWRGLMHAEPAPRANAAGAANEAVASEAAPDVGGDAIAQLMSRDHVLLGLDVADREALFVELGRFFEQRYALPAAAVAAGLAAREALGSTGLGQGVAVPHGQIKGLREAMVLYVRPVTPIAFDAPDGKPVSDIVVLLVPKWANTTHLRLLADVAERFCDHNFREQLHGCDDAHAVRRLFVEYDAG